MAFQQKEWKNRLSENPTRRTLTPVDGGTAMVVDVTRAEGTIMQQGDPFNADNMNDLEQRIADGIGGGETIIAPTEQEESENAYAVGNKLIFNGVLYDVISPIAVGNTLVPNVNIKATTVSELINILEDEFTANGNRLYMDYKNGEYGYNTSANRGADTFHPFKTGTMVYLGAVNTSAATTISVSSYVSKYKSLTRNNFYFIPTGIYGAGEGEVDLGDNVSFYYSYNSSNGVLTINQCKNSRGPFLYSSMRLSVYAFVP